MGRPALLAAAAFGIAPLTTPAPGDWVDISNYVRGFNVRRGRDHELSRTQAGTATIRLRNTDRRFDPSYNAGPYGTNVLPMTRVRLQATIAAVTYDLFQGFVTDWAQGWSPRPLGNHGDAECTAQAMDALGLLALMELVAYSAEVLNDAPLAYWRLREISSSTAVDEGSGGNNGTYTGGVTLNAAGPLAGGSGSAQFDGTNDYVAVGAGPTVLNLLGDMTLEAWVYISSVPVGAAIPVISAGDAYELEFPNPTLNGNLAFAMTTTAGTEQVTTSSPPSTGAWHHVVALRQAGNLSLYLDGALVAGPMRLLGNVKGTTFDVRLANSALHARFFNGRLAHVAIYDHALTIDRITAHYAAAFDTFVSQPTGSFVSGILDAAGWPTGERTIDTGATTIQETTPSGVALDQLLAVAEDAEQGLLMVDAGGKVLFHERTALFKPPHTVSQAVWGDGETQPSERSGLVLWLRPESLAGTADGASIATWPDSSSSANDATQATGGKQPTWEASRVNGLGLVLFDGINDRLGCASVISVAPITIFVVASKLAPQSGTRLLVETDKVAAVARIVGTDQWGVALSTNVLSGQALGSSLRLMTAVVRSPTDIDLVTDGALVNVASVAAGARAATGLGDVSAGGSALNGEIGEVLIYNRALSSDERQRIESYLARRWSIAGPAVYELPYADLDVRNDDQDLYSIVRVTRQGGKQQVASDAAAKLAYGPRTLDISGLLVNSDTDAESIAAYLLSRYKDPHPRIRGLTVSGGFDDARLAQLAGREIHFDRITVRRRPPGGGPIFAKDGNIEGVDHDVTAGQSWMTVWHLVPADTLAYWILEDPTNGVLDSTTRLAF